MISLLTVYAPLASVIITDEGSRRVDEKLINLSLTLGNMLWQS